MPNGFMRMRGTGNGDADLDQEEDPVDETKVCHIKIVLNLFGDAV